MASEERKLKVRLVRSEIGGTQRQRQTLRGLGLKHIGDERELTGTPAVLGMIDKVRHLIRVDDR
jgi:large subunit ribosomal protein L30